jgi:hypothetical protein
MSTVVSDNAGPSSNATTTSTTFGNASGKQPDRRDLVGPAAQGMATRVEERGVGVFPVDGEGTREVEGREREHATQQQQQRPQAQRPDSRSLDYILRSGLAGGLAGCAVCCYLTYFLGQWPWILLSEHIRIGNE